MTSIYILGPLAAVADVLVVLLIARFIGGSGAACERLLAAERERTRRLRDGIAANHPGGLTTTSGGESW